MIRRRIVFYGTVQGVGFRWRARHAAALYGCTGWCRNEWDGSVTMEIQGDEKDVPRVLSALENGRFIEVTRMETYGLEIREDERGFRTE
ncbi:MAG: acylphosphatase [Clostridia bacterium]|nr:acylphosphatase [Clostridia bacterium]